ncbi:MAG TPA: amidohydrolase family protein [Methylomirabilota bacterium]|nr:amidohydrolase family protein [Methylomirabilota bacterium]
MDIVDIHTHTYPRPDLGRQAMQGDGWSPYAGTIPELREAMARGGIAAAVMANLTPIPDMRDAALARLPADLGAADRADAEGRLQDELRGRLARRNRWTLEAARADATLIPFIGLDPAVMTPGELRDELEACVEGGARGVKLHPIVQRLAPATPALWPVYELCQELGLPVLFHSGFLGRSAWNALARPSAFADVLEAFPALPVILAHLGRGHVDEAVALAERFPHVVFDTCAVVTAAAVPWRMEDAEAVTLVRRLGVERVCFGSDYPWFDPAADAARLATLPGLSEGERAAILGENARRCLTPSD